MRLHRLLANLGYGTRREVTALLAAGRVRGADGQVLPEDRRLAAAADAAAFTLDGEPLDPLPGVVLMLNKPAGYTCSTADPGATVYALLPARFGRRRPVLASVGRLDRDTRGLLLMTDDGALLHRITTPRTGPGKVYEVRLARDLRGDEVAIFASGRLELKGEERALGPVELIPRGSREAVVTLHEGRYHQVRRMFAAVGNHVEDLRRVALGGLTLGGLEEGRWRLLHEAEIGCAFGAVPAVMREPARADGVLP